MSYPIFDRELKGELFLCLALLAAFAFMVLPIAISAIIWAKHGYWLGADFATFILVFSGDCGWNGLWNYMCGSASHEEVISSAIYEITKDNDWYIMRLGTRFVLDSMLAPFLFGYSLFSAFISSADSTT